MDETERRDRPEATLLKLSCDKAHADLQWRAVLSFADTVAFTVSWYRRFYEKPDSCMFDFSMTQIRDYASRARAAGLSWSVQ